MRVLGFLHTSGVHLEAFERLVRAGGPVGGTEVVAVVEPDLLEAARLFGADDRSVRDRTTAALGVLVGAGATAVMCTCSTIGGVAEAVGAAEGWRVLRVDRPMIERAVGLGSRIAVVAALGSTVGPTGELIAEVARERGLMPDVEVVLVPGAWERFAAGDVDGYLDAIAGALPGIAARVDVVVLAQASMADVAERVRVGVPVLSSSRAAVDALLG